MSWIQKLYETYNHCQSNVGYFEGNRPLLPICHITTQAHIEIAISKEGSFRRAHVITNKTDSTTIIPCSEGSASRAGSKPENHPLCDKLQYIAGDYTKFGGAVTSGFSKDPEEPYRNYVETLTKWCKSEFSHPKAEAVLKYVQKKTLVKDLNKYQILFIGDDGKFLAKNAVEREKNAPDIFSVIDPQDSAFVRWIVEAPDILEPKVWIDQSLWDSWINYYLSTREITPLCFVTGKDAILTNNHPKYIRREGDGAKLISSNDTSGFTYRGRFLADWQACSVSLEVSHKSHYALSWLISKQGYIKDDLAIIAWATSGQSIPQPTDSTLDLLGNNDLSSDEPAPAFTAQNFALKLKKKIFGYSVVLGEAKNVQVLAMDSATTGRLAITYYRELTNSDYLERLESWHSECSWIHDYGYDKGVQKNYKFIGAPTPNDIAEAAYGTNRDGKFKVDDKLRKATIKRILPCIIEGQQIPRDIVESAVRRSSNRIALEDWQWNKTLSIACALYKKINPKEKYNMVLDPDRKTRDYLYGRLLALADSLEEWALFEAREKRETNAARLMQRFAEHPFSTWRTLELALIPYKARLGGKSKKRQQMIDEVIDSFDTRDFLNDKRMSGEFLLGYHCQREFLRNIRSQLGDSEIENSRTTEAIDI